MPAGKTRQLVSATPWTAPVLALIGAIVLFPAGYMVYTSTRELSVNGVDKGSVGLDNYRALLELDSIGRILLNTAVWVVGVVAVTVVISLALAQFLHHAFPGRRLVRLAVIVPWAASVVMTSAVIYYGLQPFEGVVNRLLVDVGLLDESYGFTKHPVSGFLVSMATAVFVSLPFTTYTFLAGLAAVPEDVLEAAEVDGAGPIRRYFSVILPLLRPALAVATIINIINVFNSLPILRTMTGSISGYDADTTTTRIFKLIEKDKSVQLASALSVVNFLIVLVVILAYLAIVRPTRED